MGIITEISKNFPDVTFLSEKWVILDLNQWPLPCEGNAATPELITLQ